jgi:exonuclease III
MSFSTNLLGQGLVDAYRHLHPAGRGFTYWGWPDRGTRASLRVQGRGYRLDYFLVGYLQQRFSVHTWLRWF